MSFTRLYYLLTGLFLTFSGSAQEYIFSAPIFEDKQELTPALLPDSSILLTKSQENRVKVVRFVYEREEWIEAPNQLTDILNAMTTKGHIHLRFSQDYSKLFILKHGDGPGRLYLITKNNEKWTLPLEILEDYRDTYGNSVPSFTADNQKIYKTVPGKESNTIEVFGGNDFSLIDKIVFDEFSIIERAFTIGMDGLIVLANKVKEKGMGYYYLKEVRPNHWSAPLSIEEIPNNDSILSFDPVTTGFPGWIIYSDFLTSNIYLIKVPGLVTTEWKDREYKEISSVQATVLPTSPDPEKVGSVGLFYALLIGNADYEVDELDLDKPVQDAMKLKNVLESQYAFDSENIRILINADRSEIFQELFELRKTLTKNDNLLIFYAGHGFWDKQVKQGYWWPVDVSIENPSNWLSNSDLREQIRGINTAHTLLISDACFSGGIFKTRGAEDLRKASLDIKLLYRMPSRRAISSGTLSTVPDQSVFFEYLVKYLEQNTQKYLPSTELFTQIRRSVLSNSLTVPQDGVIMNSGDEGGDFIFIKRD